jgi:putative aldouronate transport system permease protein
MPALSHPAGKRVTAGERVFLIALYVFFALFTLLCVYPFYYLIINSISANDLSARGDVMFYPIGVHLHNYQDVTKIQGLGQSAFISVARTVLGTLCTLVGSSFLGFMFTQEKLWQRKFWYRFTVATMYFSAGLIPWYLTMMNLKLTNNFLAYVLPAIVQPFNIILIKTYIENTPASLQEAAEIDGAGVLRIYAQVVVPISMPVLATVAIFSAVGQWNAFQDTLMLMTDQKLHTLQYTLYQYINQASSLARLIQSTGGTLSESVISTATQQTPTSVRMTVSVVVVLPILLVYPIFQRFFVKGIMIGSVKG